MATGRTRTTVLTKENQGEGLPQLPVLEGFDGSWRYTPRSVPGALGEWMWIETFIYYAGFSTREHELPQEALVGSVSRKTFPTPMDAMRDADEFHGRHRHVSVISAHREPHRESRWEQVRSSWADTSAFEGGR